MLDGPNRVEARIEGLDVRPYKVGTDHHESDGTIDWDATQVVVVHARSQGLTGLGWTYGHSAAATLIESKLAPIVQGKHAMAIESTWWSMLDAVRNIGRPGIASHAIAAIDTAIWDLKAKLLGVPLGDLWGRLRDRCPVYGSGGFTSYDPPKLKRQLRGWAEQGIRMVKIKVGRAPNKDRNQVRCARDAIGPDVKLFVDANGSYERKQALFFAERFAEHGVTWFEEPVTSDDVEGLAEIRRRAPAGMRITTGEYGYDPWEFRRLIEHQVADVLQPDATRCLGFTGIRKVAALCEAHNIPWSSHTAPMLHAHLVASHRTGLHAEWFHDHVRIEHRLFEHDLRLENGELVLDLSRPGHGVSLSKAAERWAL